MNGFQISKFRPEYMESSIEQPMLWERHCHAQFEMIAVVRGDITLVLEGTPYRLQKNHAIIIPPLLYHSVTANEKGSYRRVTALFGLDAIPTAIQSTFLQRDRDAMIVASPTVERIGQACLEENKEFYAPLIECLIVQILYEALQEKQQRSRIDADDFLHKTLQYIDRHLHEKILLDDLARHTARSKSSFCHLFEEKMNISPKQYILQKKLALAGKMIEEGVPHNVVARQLGYENYSNFYRIYLKHFGVNPTKKKP